MRAHSHTHAQWKAFACSLFFPSVSFCVLFSFLFALHSLRFFFVSTQTLHLRKQTIHISIGEATRTQWVRTEQNVISLHSQLGCENEKAAVAHHSHLGRSFRVAVSIWTLRCAYCTFVFRQEPHTRIHTITTPFNQDALTSNRICVFILESSSATVSCICCLCMCMRIFLSFIASLRCAQFCFCFFFLFFLFFSFFLFFILFGSLTERTVVIDQNTSIWFVHKKRIARHVRTYFFSSTKTHSKQTNIVITIIITITKCWLVWFRSLHRARHWNRSSVHVRRLNGFKWVQLN